MCQKVDINSQIVIEIVSCWMLYVFAINQRFLWPSRAEIEFGRGRIRISETVRCREMGQKINKATFPSLYLTNTLLDL